MGRGCSALSVAVVVTIHSALAFAQTGEGLDCERFKPAIDSQGVILTEGGQGELGGDLNIGFFVHYSRNPLVIMHGGEILQSLVSDRFSGDFVISMGMTDWLTLGVDVPAVFFQQGIGPNQGTGTDGGLASGALGDVRVAPKLTVLREKLHGVSLALQVPVSLPSGDELAFIGSKSVTASPMLAVSRHFAGDRLFLALNVGTWLLEEVDYRDLEAGFELFYRVGTKVRFAEDWWVLGELSAAGKLSNLFHNRPNETPLEWLMALRYQGPWDLGLTLGGAAGGLPGWGTPNFRGFFGLLWAPRIRDQDGAEPPSAIRAQDSVQRSR